MIEIIWDLDDDPEGNVRHCAQHHVTQDEVLEVLTGSLANTAISKSSGQPITFGYTTAGRYLGVVWEAVNDDPFTVYPITAYDVPEPTKG